METQCGTRKPITRKLHGRSWTRWMLMGKIFGHFQCLFNFLCSNSLRLSSVFLFFIFWELVAACWRRGVWASWMPLWPLGQSAGTHGREAAVWAGSFSDAPGAWSAVKPQLMKKPTRWGKRRICQWKLNHLSSSALSSSSSLSRFSSPLILTSVQQGKLYRPKGRLTSLKLWNRSD